MVGRYSDLSVYKDILKSEDFIKVLLGSLLIPFSFIFRIYSVKIMSIILISSILINGLPIIKDAIIGIFKLKVNVDELVSIAIVACVVNGYYLEGAIVCAIMVIGALIEETVSDSARKEIEKLIALTPDEAVVELAGIETMMKITEIQIGHIIIIKAGDVFPLDGVIFSGSTSVDESSITGESLPVYKETGSSISAGTLNLNGFVKMEVTKKGEDSTISKVIKLIQSAENGKIDSDKIVDKYAAFFTPFILIFAIITYIVTKDISRATTVLIVGCPCSFLLTGPVTTVAAISRAAKAGIIVKGGKYLEKIAISKAVYFDKTGTLTTGKPSVISVYPHGDYTEYDVLKYAASIEIGSNHPLAGAILARAKELNTVFWEVKNSNNIPGLGIEGLIEDKHIFVGIGSCINDTGYTMVEVQIDSIVIGEIALYDSPRRDAAQMISMIKSLGIKDIAIISGDQGSAVKSVAEDIGINNFYSRLKPADKLNKVQELGGDNLIYVGDGINDSPALKAAGAGIAMGLNGADVALETADIVLMNNNLLKIPFLIKLSRRMTKTIKFNILLSFGINIASLIAASLGLLTPILGAISHNIGSILVVFISASLALIKENR